MCLKLSDNISIYNVLPFKFSEKLSVYEQQRIAEESLLGYIFACYASLHVCFSVVQIFFFIIILV